MNNEVSSYSILHGDTEAQRFLFTPSFFSGSPRTCYAMGQVCASVLNKGKAYLFPQNPLKVDRVNSYLKTNREGRYAKNAKRINKILSDLPSTAAAQGQV